MMFYQDVSFLQQKRVWAAYIEECMKDLQPEVTTKNYQMQKNTVFFFTLENWAFAKKKKAFEIWKLKQKNNWFQVDVDS